MGQVDTTVCDIGGSAHFLVGGQGKAKEEGALELGRINNTYHLFSCSHVPGIKTLEQP